MRETSAVETPKRRTFERKRKKIIRKKCIYFRYTSAVEATQRRCTFEKKGKIEKKKICISGTRQLLKHLRDVVHLKKKGQDVKIYSHSSDSRREEQV